MKNIAIRRLDVRMDATNAHAPISGLAWGAAMLLGGLIWLRIGELARLVSI